MKKICLDKDKPISDFVFGHALCWVIKKFGYGTYRFEGVYRGGDLRPSIRFIKERFKNKYLYGAEIGVKHGHNAIRILKELNMKMLYLVDSWENYDDDNVIRDFDFDFKIAMTNLQPYKNIDVLREYSSKAACRIKDATLDFVYVDGNHAYNYVIADLRSYWLKIGCGGVLCGHDIVYPSVRGAVKDFSNEVGCTYYIKKPDWWILKKDFVVGDVKEK